MELPEAQELDVLLEPDLDAIRVRGAGIDDRAAEPLTRRLTITGPVHQRIRSGDVDDSELKKFIQREGKRYWFHAIRLACSFRPDEDEPFTECWIGVDLSCASGTSDVPPVAWSMEPQRLEQVTEISTKFTFNAGLKLSPVNLGVGGEHDKTRKQKEACLQAYGELGSSPWWELYAVEGVELRGMQQLKMVVRTSAGVAVDGITSIEAKILRHRFGIMKYRVILPGDPPATHFRLE